MLLSSSTTSETKTKRDMTQNEIKASDELIKAAVQQLGESERGKLVLAVFRQMMLNAGGIGLDSQNWNALLVLFREVKSGRRDFLRELPTPTNNPLVENVVANWKEYKKIASQTVGDESRQWNRLVVALNSLANE